MKNPPCCQEMADYQNFPHVSIIIPFDPKMKNKPHLEEVLNSYVLQTEKDLLGKYDPEMVIPLIRKLKLLITKIDDPGHKSIALFLSKSKEKLIYFNQSDFLESHPYPKA